MSEDKLTRDDLVLLMESYRNMITMHQTILDQSTKTIEKMDIIAGKQDALFSKQGNLCNTLDKVATQLNTVGSEISDSTKNTNSHEKKAIEHYGKIVNKIHLGWIGMGTIILSLIGLIVALTQFMQHLHPPV